MWQQQQSTDQQITKKSCTNSTIKNDFKSTLFLYPIFNHLFEYLSPWLFIIKLLNTKLVLLQKKILLFFDQSLLFWMVYCLFHYKHISMWVISLSENNLKYFLELLSPKDEHQTLWNFCFVFTYIYINIFKICGPPKKKRFWVKCVVLMVLEYFFRSLLFIIVLEISL